MGAVGCGGTEGQENKGKGGWKGACRECFTMYDRDKKKRKVSRDGRHVELERITGIERTNIKSYK